MPESTGWPFASNTARFPSTASRSLSAFSARASSSPLTLDTEGRAREMTSRSSFTPTEVTNSLDAAVSPTSRLAIADFTPSDVTDMVSSFDSTCACDTRSDFSCVMPVTYVVAVLMSE